MRARIVVALTITAVAASGCGIDESISPYEPPSWPSGSDVRIDVEHLGPAANRRVLGSNCQWVDHGDGLIADDLSFVESLLEPVAAIAPSILRYPGGTLSDAYHWKDGVGPASQRKKNAKYPTTEMQTVVFGTDEFLALCARLGAEPLISVNVVTGTPAEAAAWVAHTNLSGAKGADGKPLPTVHLWEIGNEPYVEVELATVLAPDVFADRANAFIKAMRAVDPTIEVSIPLRSDAIGGISVTPFSGYDEAVLAGITEPFDLASVHDAFLPFALDAEDPSPEDLYLAAVAAPIVTEEDFDATRAALDAAHPERSIPLALTEHHAVFTLGAPETDPLMASFAGAMFTADLLRIAATRDDLALANFWSLTGDWYYGAFTNTGIPRPAAAVLRGFGDVLRGNLVPVAIDAPRLSTPTIGLSPARDDLPSLTGVATREGNTVRVLLINKAPEDTSHTVLSWSGDSTGKAARIRRLTPNDVFYVDDTSEWLSWHDDAPPDPVLPMLFDVPPHSLAIVEIDLAPAAP